MGDLRENQQALRDQLKRLMEELRKKGFGQGPQGQGEMDQLGRAGEAMGDAEGQLGEGNADGAVDSQGRALEALRRGAQNLAQSMQQQGMLGPGPNGQPGRLGLPRAQQDTDPLAGLCAGATMATTPQSRCPARSTCSARVAFSRNCGGASGRTSVRSSSWTISSGCCGISDTPDIRQRKYSGSSSSISNPRCTASSRTQWRRA